MLFAPAIRGAIGDRSTFDVFRAVFDGWHDGTVAIEDRVDASLYFELKTFFHGLLVVEDKLSMAHSLETRVPFLDEDLLAYALAMSPREKLRDLEHAPSVGRERGRQAVAVRARVDRGQGDPPRGDGAAPPCGGDSAQEDGF